MGSAQADVRETSDAGTITAVLRRRNQAEESSIGSSSQVRETTSTTKIPRHDFASCSKCRMGRVLKERGCRLTVYL
jgi:hypothetical protein